MGYKRHHAVVVTGHERVIGPAHAKALGLFGLGGVSGLVRSEQNGYQSFFVAPDGSNEKWEASDRGDGLRAAFVEWLRAQYHEDGGSSLDWVEVQYGDDYGETLVAGSSDDDTSDFRERYEENANGFWEPKR